MSPAHILSGTALRLLAALFLISYAVIAVATEARPSFTVGAAFGTLVLIPSLAMIAIIVRRRYQPEWTGRYALASFAANAGMALCLTVHLVISTDFTGIHVVGIFLAIWHIFMTRNRYNQILDGTYLRRFEAKPKLPSAWAVLKQARR